MNGNFPKAALVSGHPHFPVILSCNSLGNVGLCRQNIMTRGKEEYINIPPSYLHIFTYPSIYYFYDSKRQSKYTENMENIGKFKHKKEISCT